MSKTQINFRLPDTLIAALKERAELDGKTTTEVAVSLLETGLGLPSTSTPDPRIASIEERIAKQLAYFQVQMDQRVKGLISSSLASHLAPLQAQVLELTQYAASQTAAQTELLQAELDQVNQRIEKRIQAAIQNFGSESQALTTTSDNLSVEAEAVEAPFGIANVPPAEVRKEDLYNIQELPVAGEPPEEEAVEEEMAAGEPLKEETIGEAAIAGGSGEEEITASSSPVAENEPLVADYDKEELGRMLKEGLAALAVDQTNISSVAIPQSMTGSGLGERLIGASQSDVSKNKGKKDFFEWTKVRDPDKIGWRYDPNVKSHYKFFPVLDTTSV